MADQLDQVPLFPSTLYTIDLPQFLDTARAVSAEALKVVREAGMACCNKLFPHTMTGNYASDPRLQDFVQYVAQTAWNVLEAQGYAMAPLATAVAEMWTQEHEYSSDMPVHVHPGGIQMCAFYFLDCPENSPFIVLHDPRAGKCAAQLLQADMAKLTAASDQIVLPPKEGTLMLANSWLPHSFTRNGSKEPFRFIHINITVVPAPPAVTPEVEVV